MVLVFLISFKFLVVVVWMVGFLLDNKGSKVESDFFVFKLFKFIIIFSLVLGFFESNFDSKGMV